MRVDHVHPEYEGTAMTITVESFTQPADAGLSTVPASRGRVDWLTNLSLLAALWSVYAIVRNLKGETELAALGNASRLLSVESALGIDIEQAVQAAIAWPQAMIAANTYYLLHFPLTLTVLGLAFWCRRSTVFPVVRNSIIGCTAVALVVHFVIPMAPPRMLPGFVDASSAFGPDPYALAGSESANQFAAMPSMHVAWAILVAYGVWQFSSRRVVRTAAVLHPIITTFVVIVTGHHFVTDAVIGAAIAVVTLVISTRVRTKV